MSAAHDHGPVIPTPVRPRRRGGLRLVTGSRDAAAAVGADVTLNPDAALAVAELVRLMASELDRADARYQARQTKLLAANTAEVERRRAASAEAAQLRQAVDLLLPRDVCLTNPNVRDDTIVELSCSLGELRTAAGLANGTRVR